MGGLGGGRLARQQAALEEHAGQPWAGLSLGQELPADRCLSWVMVPSRTHEGRTHRGPPRDSWRRGLPNDSK